MSMHPADSCPRPEELAALTLGTLPADAWDAVASHVEACPRCAAALGSCAERADELVASLRGLRGTDLPSAADGWEAEVLALSADGPGGSGVDAILEAPTFVVGPKRLREYRLLERLGEGGMGTVYRAVHTRLEKVVALKVLAPGRMDNPDAVVRFLREMKAIGKLSHPNIVQATDAGEEGGTHFLVMEYIEGTDLARLVYRCGPLAIPEACELVRQAAAGLGHVHASGLVHRDVKPSNLLLTPAGQVKLLDLGLALLRDRRPADGDSTASAFVLGSFDYMAPEQGDDPHAVDARADLYALGCTLYHLLVGRPPFPAPQYRTPLQKLKAHATLPVPRLRDLRPDVPEGLARVVDQLLAKDPADRLARAADVVRALEPFPRGSDLARLYRTACPGSGELEAAPATSTASGRTPELSAPAARTAGPRRRRWPFVLAAAVVGLVALLGAAVVYVRTGDGTLEIESDDKEVKVLVEQDGKEVSLVDLKTNQRVRLRSGKYRLKVDGRDDLELALNDFELQRNGVVIARVRRRPAGAVTPGPVAALPDPVELARRPSAADALRREALPALSGMQVPRELVAALGAGPGPHQQTILAVAFSPRSDRLAAVGGTWDSKDKPGEVRVWDVGTGELFASLTGHAGAVMSAAFSPDGKLLATASLDGTVRVWDVAAGTVALTYKGHTQGVHSAVFTDAGRRIVSAGGDEHKPGEIKVWDVRTGNTLLSLRGHENRIAQAAVSPDGKLLASAGWDGLVKLWDAVTGQELRALKGHHGWVQCVAFSPDGRRVLSGGYDGNAVLWDTATGAEVYRLPKHPRGVHAVSFRPDGRRLATACWDGHVRVFEAATGKEAADLPRHEAGVLGVAAVAFSPDGDLLASGGQDRTAKVWDLAHGRERLVAGPRAAVTGLAVSPDGRTLAAGDRSNLVRLWDLATGRPVRTLAGHTGFVRQVAFSPDGRVLASAGGDQTIRLWDPATGAALHTLRGHGKVVHGIAFAPDGRTLVSGSHDTTLKVWDVATGRELHLLRGHTAEVGGVAYSPDGRYVASASDDGTVRVWDVAREQAVLTLNGHGCPVSRVVFFPDGRRLASGDAHGQVKIWDLATARELATLEDHGTWILSLAIRADGRSLASAGADGGVRLWDLGSEPPRRTDFPFFRGRGTVEAVAFTPEGRYLATAQSDGTIFVLRLAPAPAP